MTRERWSQRPYGARLRLGVAAAAVVVGAFALAGCASVRNELGTADSACYIGLPEAVAAVHHHGHLFGVRLVSVSSLERQAPLLYEAARKAPGRSTSQVCLVAFGGTFTAGAVQHPLGRAASHLAVVELAYPDKRLFGTVLLRRPFLAFGHTHI